jgi:hypothetical protein
LQNYTFSAEKMKKTENIRIFALKTIKATEDEEILTDHAAVYAGCSLSSS